MSEHLVSVHVIRNLLAEQCKAEITQYQWATKHHISPAYVSDFLNGRRDPGEALLKALGFRKAMRYEKVTT
jgi:predicted transcriptional regulator